MGQNRLDTLLTAFAIALLLATSSGGASLVTFDTVPEGTVLPFGGEYHENGMRVISASYNSLIGDPLLMIGTNGVYFHGAGEYVEFSMLNGSSFDLLSLDLITNVRPDRLIATSSNPTFVSIGPFGLDGAVSHIIFSGPEYSTLQWFQIGTMHFGTEVDNITFQSYAVAEPTTLLLWGTTALGFGLLRARRRKTGAELT